MILQAKHLAAALTHAAKNDVRYYLKGICLEFSRPTRTLYVVSTDGHRVFVGRVNDVETDIVESFSIIVPADKLKAVLALKTPVLALAKADNNTYSLGGVAFNPIDRRFPDWRRNVVRQSDLDIEPSPCQIDPKYYIDAHKALCTWAGKLVSKGIDIVTRQTSDFMYIQHIVDQTAFVKVMAQRMNGATVTDLGIEPFVPTPAREVAV